MYIVYNIYSAVGITQNITCLSTPDVILEPYLHVLTGQQVSLRCMATVTRYGMSKHVAGLFFDRILPCVLSLFNTFSDLLEILPSLHLEQKK
jgi:hypothetical protein